MEKSYPILNEEGKNLIPYTFTIKNTCDTYASYQINLEVLNTSTLINLDTIRVLLNKTNFEKDSSLLKSYEQVEKTLANATTSYKLETGYLNKEEEKTFELILWLDENTPPDEAYMNKVLESKVTIITSYLNESPSYAEVITNCSNNGYKTTICMLENSSYDITNLAYDETEDNNLRYVGASPNNYVDFNNEKWRIIGVMNNVLDGDGVLDSRIKLIRDESIGEYSWDTSASSINSGSGINEWSQSKAMKLLNPGYENESIGGSLYWNQTSGNCYNGENNSYISCNFIATGLLNASKSMIDNVVWYTGTTHTNYQKETSYKLYGYERSNNIGKICSGNPACNDSVARTVKWVGKVGLIYLSDYGYASKDKLCLNSILDYRDYSQNCKINNWLSKETYSYWSISPVLDPNNSFVATNVAYVYMGGGICGYHAAGRNDLHQSIRPTIYLKSNIKIISGDGTKENSYQLQI